MEKEIKLTPEQEERYTIIRSCIDKDITNKEAAKRLSLEVRQVQRIKRNVEAKGKAGILHGRIGQSAYNKTTDTLRKKVSAFMKKNAHKDFGPTFASEQLEEQKGIKLSKETIRAIFIREGIRKNRKQKRVPIHRQWRPRMDMYGELIQFDGSYHDWFETGKEACLLAAIDDATSIPTLVFDDNEGIHAVFRFWWEYFLSRGLPVAIYLDKFSTYKINHINAVDNVAFMTQFQRAMNECCVRLISAHSPEAKGRVERLFETLQDRLVKYLRLAGIKKREGANIYLREQYEKMHRDTFSVSPRQAGDAHRSLTQDVKERLPAIFSIQSTRVVQGDYTISFKNIWYQIKPTRGVTVYKKDNVIIEERLDGSMHLRHGKGVYLEYEKLPERPQQQKKQPIALVKNKPYVPPKDHPWRRSFGKK